MKIKVFILMLILISILTISLFSEKKYIMRGDYDYPPYEYLDNDLFTPKGFSVELLTAISEVMGLDIDIKLGPWDEVRLQIENGSIDGITSMYYSIERSKKVDFSTPHTMVTYSAFIRKDNTTIKSLNSIKNQTIIIQKGDIMDDYLIEHTLTKKVIYAESQLDALRMLAAGKGQLALLSKMSSIYFIREYNLSNIVPVVDLPETFQYCFAVKKGNDQLLNALNEGLKIVKLSGKYKEIYDKWFGVIEKQDSLVLFRNIILFIVVPFVIIIIFITIWIIILRRQVNKKTLELKNELEERKKVEEQLEVTNFQLIEANKTLNLRNSELKKVNMELTASNEEIKAMNEDLEFTYIKLDKLNSDFETMIRLISRIKVEEVGSEDLLKEMLEIAYQLAGIADAGSVSITEGDHWRFIETIGHDLVTLQSLPLKADYMVKPEKAVLYKNIGALTSRIIPDEILEKYNSATISAKETLLAPLKLGNKVVGNIALDISPQNRNNFDEDSVKIIDVLSILSSAFLTMKNYVELEDKIQHEIIMSIVKILEIHDEYTKGHSEFVAEYSFKIAKKLGYDEKQCKSLYYAGLLHDIGKILVPSPILNKPGKLTDDEYDIIKMHPVYGYQILSSSKELNHIGHIIQCHHERYDGKGYPNGIQGEEIPIESRILAVADSWNAMTSNRKYRQSMDKKIALYELYKGKWTQFDGDLVDIFLSIISE